MVWQTALRELLKKTDIYSRAFEHNFYVNPILKQVSGITSYVFDLKQHSRFYSHISILPYAHG